MGEREKLHRRLTLRGPGGVPFLRRNSWGPRRLGAVMIHHLDARDPGADLHDHPWWFLSIVLRGGYTEEFQSTERASHVALAVEPHEILHGQPLGSRPRGIRRRWGRFTWHSMPLSIAHRIVEVEPGTMTLIIRGPRRREWGFFQPEGRVLHTDYDFWVRRDCTEDRAHG